MLCMWKFGDSGVYPAYAAVERAYLWVFREPHARLAASVRDQYWLAKQIPGDCMDSTLLLRVHWFC